MDLNNSRIKVKINNQTDATEFACICQKYSEDIDLIHGRYIVDAKSILGVMTVMGSKDIEVSFHGDPSKFASDIQSFID